MNTPTSTTRPFPVFNKTRHQRLGEKIRWADHLSAHLQGRLASPPFQPEEGMLVPSSRLISLEGFRQPIDIIFLTPERKVLACYPALKPGQQTAVHPEAYYVLELPEGVIGQTHTQINDQLTWAETSPVRA